MKIYFVRHGESELNAGDMHQFKTTPLSEVGREQAEKVAKRFLHIPIDHIFSSTFTRASQTAEIIASHVQKDITYSDFLGELKRPSEVEGKLTHAAEVVAIKKEIENHYFETDWHYSDEENYQDFLTRGVKAIELLEKPEYENILVITHGDIMRMMVSLNIFGQRLSPEIFLALTNGLDIKNTGITMLKKNTDGWRLITWNDFSHIENS